jgi:hypothetical protein
MAPLMQPLASAGPLAANSKSATPESAMIDLMAAVLCMRAPSHHQSPRTAVRSISHAAGAFVLFPHAVPREAVHRSGIVPSAGVRNDSGSASQNCAQQRSVR